MSKSSDLLAKSQHFYGPFSLSYGDLERQLPAVRFHYKLTGEEFLILGRVCQAMYRKGYCSHLGEILRYKTDFWTEASFLPAPHVSRAFTGLVKKGCLLKHKGPGKRVYYSLTPHLSHEFYVQDVQPMVIKVPVDNVDNSETSYQSGNNHVTDLATSSYQSGNNHVTDLATSSYQSGNLPLYIEDFPTLLPKDSLPIVSSNFPSEQTVDNTRAINNHASTLFSMSIDKSVEVTQSWILKTQRMGVPLEDVVRFINYLRAKGLKGLGAYERDKTFALWHESDEMHRMAN